MRRKSRRETSRLSVIGGSVFAAGFSTMGAEMAAPRLLAPYVGTTQIVWTSVIGVLLGALAAGGFLGGRLADRWPDRRSFGTALIGAGVALAAVPVVAHSLLRRGASALGGGEFAPFALSLMVVSLLFAPPVLLLGTIGPWAVRLTAAGRSDLGRIAGILSGLATAGSIAGTFATTLGLLPLLGTKLTLAALSAALVVAGVIAARFAARDAIAVGLVVACLAWSARGPSWAGPETLFEGESLYNSVRVTGTLDGPRALLLNEGIAAQSVTLPPEGRVGGVWGTVASAIELAPRPATRERTALIIGLAGGTVAAQIVRDQRDGGVRIDGIEIDPVVLNAGRRYLELGRIPGLHVTVGDGRLAMRQLLPSYDLIVVDAYRGSYLPAHLATVEFFEECRDHLASQGVLVLNVAAGRTGTALQDALAATLRAAFPSVGTITVPPSLSPVVNTVLVASRDEFRVSPKAPAVLRLPSSPDDASRVLTDDRAPVEILTDASLLGLLGIRL